MMHPSAQEPPTDTNQNEACLLGYLAHQHVSSPWLRVPKYQPALPTATVPLGLLQSEGGKTEPASMKPPLRHDPQTEGTLHKTTLVNQHSFM